MLCSDRDVGTSNAVYVLPKTLQVLLDVVSKEKIRSFLGF